MTEQSRPEAELTDHSYDGIQEYDNPLPGWWSALFALTAVFSLLYGVQFHWGGGGKDMHASYESEVAKVFKLRFKQLGTLSADRNTLLKYLDKPDWLLVGRGVFQTHCVSCHGAAGQGLVGPNLTDDHWKNVTRIEDIATVIEHGAANGSMPAWGKRLGHVNKLVLTAAYVASLRGTSPSGGKMPEGSEIPAWDAGH